MAMTNEHLTRQIAQGADDQSLCRQGATAEQCREVRRELWQAAQVGRIGNEFR